VRFDKAAIYIRANVAQRVGQRGRGAGLGRQSAIAGFSLREQWPV